MIASLVQRGLGWAFGGVCLDIFWRLTDHCLDLAITQFPFLSFLGQ